MITDVDGDIIPVLNSDEMPTSVPLLVTRNVVIFPCVLSTIFVTRPGSIKLVKEYEKKGDIIGVATQKDPSVETPERNDIFDYGVYARNIPHVWRT